MSIKKIQLNGTETAVQGLSGYYAVITNLSEDNAYASISPDIAVSTEQALAIPQGASVCVALPLNANTVYLLGTGTIYIEETDVICNTTSNASIYYVDTKVAEAKRHAESITSNPNLLINPDFKINQRGLTEYNTAGYTVDGWKINDNVNLSILDNGRIAMSVIDTTKGGELFQPLECDFSTLSGRPITLSVMLDDGAKHTTTGTVSADEYAQSSNICVMYIPVNGAVFHVGLKYSTALKRFVTNVWIPVSSGIEVVDNIETIKLELGSVATPFVPPAPATELMKCQRYYQIHTTGEIDPTDLRPSMWGAPEISVRSDGNYEYVAEL